MNFFKEHKQLFLNLFFGAALFCLMGAGVYAQAEPAEKAAEPAENPQTAADEEMPVVDDETSALEIRQSEAYAQSCALQSMGLVDWETDGEIPTSKLNAVAETADGIAVIEKLQGEKTGGAAANDQETAKDTAEKPGGNAAGTSSAQAAKPDKGADGKTTDPLRVDVYAEMLTETLQKQGCEISETYFDKYKSDSDSLTYGALAAMTYDALQCQTAEADTSDGSDGAEAVASLGETLVQAGVITEDAAVMADLPVKENTDENYEALFIKSLEENSEPFVYSEKNKELMLKLMKDRSSHFALINQEFTLDKNFVPKLTGSGNMQMEPTAYENLQTMLKDAKAAGLTVNMRSGYRSFARQTQLYGNGNNIYRAAPGTSEHQSGLAMDVVNGAGALDDKLSNSAEAKWLAENCWKYGFVIRYTDEKADITGYPAEWWHVRYLGKTLAYELYHTGMCYEEFFAACGGVSANMENAADTDNADSADNSDNSDNAAQDEKNR